MERIENGKTIARRQSLQAAATFMILPAGFARGYAVNDKLNIGVIGLTGMGGVDAKTFNGLGENIAAVRAAPALLARPPDSLKSTHSGSCDRTAAPAFSCGQRIANVPEAP